MKSTALVTATALVAALFSLSAHAQTGRPSSVEVRSAAGAPRVAANDQELGSYARYLMLNGATRDDAVAAARNIDHPAGRKLVASQDLARPAAPSTARQ
jgi:hypothetical protein